MKVSKFDGGWGLVLGAVASVGLLAGCSGPKFAEVPGVTVPQGAITKTGSAPRSAVPPTGSATPEQVSTASLTHGIDRISIGDNLTIMFADLPMVQQPIFKERVREDGTITLLQNQSFLADGKNRGELEKEIRKRYVPDYYKTMTVSVTPEVNTQFFYVDGEVKKPDRQVYLARITVLKAIASANGFTDFARKRAVILTRADGSKFTINCPKAIADPNLDLEVYPGDKIYVPRRNPIW